MLIIKFIARRIAKMQYWELAMYIAILGLVVFFVSMGDCKKIVSGPLDEGSIHKEEFNIGDFVQFEPRASSECIYEGYESAITKIVTFSSHRYYYVVPIGVDKTVVVSVSGFNKDKFEKLANGGETFKFQGKIVNKRSDVDSAMQQDKLFDMMGNMYDRSSVDTLTEDSQMSCMLEYKGFIGVFAVNVLGILMIIASIAVFFVKKHLQMQADAEFERIKHLSKSNKISKSELDEEFDRIVRENKNDKTKY